MKHLHFLQKNILDRCDIIISLNFHTLNLDEWEITFTKLLFNYLENTLAKLKLRTTGLIIKGLPLP